MKIALIMAFGALAFTVSADLLFKLENMLERDTPVLLFFFYMSLAAFLTAALAGPKQLVTLFSDPVTIASGAALGLTAVTCYYFYLSAFKGLDAAVNSTIFRLGLVFTMLYSTVLLGEALTALKLLATGGCVVSLFLFTERKTGGAFQSKYFLFSILACLTMGLVNPLTKCFVLAGAASTALLTGRFFFMVLFTGLLLVFTRTGFRIKRRALLLALVSGAVLFCSCTLMIKAMNAGEVSVVTPIANMSFVIVALVGVGFFHEKMTMKKGLGCVVAAATVVMLTFA